MGKHTSIIIGTILAIWLVCLSAFAHHSYMSYLVINKQVQDNTEVLSGGNWTCVAQTCKTWVYGDDWITDNCRPVGENKTLVCNILLQDGTAINAPLSAINISNVKSCREYQCLTEVYVKGSMGERI